MPMKEKTCTPAGGKHRTSYYYSCQVEIPTLTFSPEDEDDDIDRDEL
jgi:hypothetical protein